MAYTVSIHTFLSPLFAGAVDVIFELDTHLSLVRLVSDEWVFQELLGGWPLSVVLHQTAFNKVKELLGPETERFNTERKYEIKAVGDVNEVAFTLTKTHLFWQSLNA